MKASCLLLFLLTLLAGCATEPLHVDSGGLAIENGDVGFRGYRLTVPEGYTATSPETAQTYPVLQRWLKQRENFFQRIRIDPDLKDQAFLMKENRVVLFTVEGANTRVPFSRLAPDRRERLLRYMTHEFYQRSTRFGVPTEPFNFERIGSREIVRTRLFDDSPLVETMGIAVLGGLNEIYHFEGLAFEGEGVFLEEDMLNLIRNLSF